MNPTKQLYEAAKTVLFGWSSRLTHPRSEWTEKLQTLADAISAYEQSETSPRQQENETKTEIWHKWDSEPDLSYNDAAYGAMLEYASQQTADKDRKIAELKQRISELENII